MPEKNAQRLIGRDRAFCDEGGKETARAQGSPGSHQRLQHSAFENFLVEEKTDVMYAGICFTPSIAFSAERARFALCIAVIVRRIGVQGRTGEAIRHKKTSVEGGRHFSVWLLKFEPHPLFSDPPCPVWQVGMGTGPVLNAGFNLQT